ncbi:hypothetical protein K9M41_04015 [Candidatus Gracilibacteria bacterium]|nr:hypothetical protein [Candidatus Gracilibacteria bacterium]
MNFIEFLSPLLRRNKLFVSLFVVFFIVFFGLAKLIPDAQKTTVYFSVKPVVSSQPMSTSLDPIESASKVAEAVSGWAKDPGFRNEILSTAEVEIKNFKRKLTARRQNRLNVFWTIKLSKPEWQHAEKITAALLEVFNKNFSDLNEQSSTPFEISSPSVSRDLREFPFSWIILASLLISLFLSFLGVYLYEAFTDRVSFVQTVWEVFPDSPIMRINQKVGAHNPSLLEQFIITFESPRLISTFSGAEKFFQLAPLDAIDEELDVPILLVKLGETKVRDLENMLAIFGDEIGIIVFEK